MAPREELARTAQHEELARMAQRAEREYRMADREERE